MRNRHTTTAALATAALLTLTACATEAADSSSDSATSSATASTGRHFDTAQDIVDALKGAGFTASTPQENTDESYITQVGGTAYGFTVTDKADQPAPGNTNINMFPNAEALAAWIPLSKSLGGIAVTSDTWAVSLPTRSEAARTDSQRLAPQIAKALGGTVQR